MAGHLLGRIGITDHETGSVVSRNDRDRDTRHEIRAGRAQIAPAAAGFLRSGTGCACVRSRAHCWLHTRALAVHATMWPPVIRGFFSPVHANGRFSLPAIALYARVMQHGGLWLTPSLIPLLLAFSRVSSWGMHAAFSS